MIVRTTARLLTVVMLLASGRLLACGWECIDELAAPAAASCHQDSAPAAAVSGDPAHACLPEIAEPSVTVAKPVAAHSLAAAPLVTAFVTADRSIGWFTDRLHSHHLRFESPHSPALSILRI